MNNTASSIPTHADVLAADLSYGGATAEFDGISIRLIVGSDYDTSVSDYDCYGQIEWTRDAGARGQRPANMNGNAEVIDVDYPHRLWWQPVADGPRRGTPEFVEHRQHVLDLVRYGFYFVAVEVTIDDPALGELNYSALLVGVDVDSGSYVAEVAADLFVEAMTEYRRDADSPLARVARDTFAELAGAR